MHLSNEIQRTLVRLNSNIKLASTIDGIFPSEYSFYNKVGRSFRTEFASDKTHFSIVLFERINEYDYENCFARGLFDNIERLTTVIDLWVGKQQNVLEIKTMFDEIELYKDFEFKNPNKHIDDAWTKVKNMFFNDTEYWKHPEWNSRYIEMLYEAKRHISFQNYFPFTSHYWLRFSIDKDLTETWELGTYIIPTVYSTENPTTLGKFYVSYNEGIMGGKFFNSLNDALDFYAEKLKQVNPTK